MASAIRAVVPQIIPREERQAVVSELSGYLTHSDEGVRASAVKTVAVWGTNEQNHVIEEGLRDGSLRVRHSAAGAALRSSIRSDAIKDSLVAMMNNPTEDMEVREQAHYALTNYALDGADYDDFYRFNKDRERFYQGVRGEPSQ